MLSIFTQASIDTNEELKAEVFSKSAVGNLVPVNLMGDTNGYYIISGYAHDGALTAPERLEDEITDDYIARLKPTALQGFADLAAGSIPAITLSNEDLKLLINQPEFKQEEV